MVDGLEIEMIANNLMFPRKMMIVKAKSSLINHILNVTDVVTMGTTKMSATPSFLRRREISQISLRKRRKKHC